MSKLKLTNEEKIERRKLRFLNERNSSILSKWNTCKYTLEEIGEEYQITRERVRQIIKKAAILGIAIKSVDDVSKGRSKAKLISQISLIDIDKFISLYESGMTINEIMSELSIKPSLPTYVFRKLLKKLVKEKKISCKKHTVNRIKIFRQKTSQQPEEISIRSTIIKMRGQDKSLREIATACDLSKPAISKRIRQMTAQGIYVPASSKDPGIYEYSLESRDKKFSDELYEIDVYLEKGIPISSIATIMKINIHTLYELIYENF